MNPTPEQLVVIQSSGNARINAVAGSGKTTTLVEYARHRPNKRIIYLAFNRAPKAEAEQKFKDLTHVAVETVHSLAFRHIMKGSKKYTLHEKEYRSGDLVKLLPIEGDNLKEVYTIAKHVQRLIEKYCHSDLETVKEFPYKGLFTEPKAMEFLESHYKDILRYAVTFLMRMQNGEIGITHNFYLKLFQRRKISLDYDIILFDEAQDASPVMLDIILRQKADKIIVGDTHQQIYGWRLAINSLEKVDFPSFQLNQSFRFGKEIAHIANQILAWKKVLCAEAPPLIEGCGTRTKIKTHAILGRSNLALLAQAIKLLIKEKTVKKIWFEGDFNSYTIAEEGSTLYDVLYLFKGQREKIRDKVIAAMKDLAELEEFAKTSGDGSILTLIEIIDEYGDQISNHLNSIKNALVPKGEKEKADVIFSTVHRCKGLEYDEVFLLDDFITLDEIQKYEKEELTSTRRDTIIEEINVLYVAVTRAIAKVTMPSHYKMLFPSPPVAATTVEKAKPLEQSKHLTKRKRENDPVKKQVISPAGTLKNWQIDPEDPPLDRPWNRFEDDNLRLLIKKALTYPEIARRLKRKVDDVIKRAELLGNALF
jgi:F-box protein, helicase, 18